MDQKDNDPFLLGEEVLDLPGLPGEDAMTTSISVDVYLALKTAFDDLKGRFLELDQRNHELTIRLKKKERKDSSSSDRVYHERDELLEKLKKSYAAFQEKYGENEGLKNKAEEMEAETKGLKKKYEEAEAEIERLRKSCKEVEAENEQMKKTCKEMEAENEELKKKSEEMEAEIVDLKNRLETLNTEVTLTSKDLQLRQKEVEELKIEQTQRKKDGSDSELGSPKVVGNYLQASTSSKGTLTLEKLLQKLESCGLQVIVRCEALFFSVVDKGKLKIWLAEITDNSATIIFGKFMSEDRSTCTETERIYSWKEYDLVSRNHLDAEGKVILLKQTIEDQAQEICRLRDFLAAVMHQQSKNNAEKQKTLEEEVKDLRRNKEEGSTPKVQTGNGVGQVKKRENRETERRLGNLLGKVVTVMKQLTQLHKELNTQGKFIQRLTQMTDRSTNTMSTESRDREDTEIQILTSRSDQEEIDERLVHLGEDNTPLSIPIQETNPSFRVRRIGDPTRGLPSEAREVSTDEGTSVEEEPPLLSLPSRGPPVEAASPQTLRTESSRRSNEAGANLPHSGEVTNLRSFSNNVVRPVSEWTGESDIEVIDEDDHALGATSMRGGLVCPVCDRYFTSACGQTEFEHHVRSHFDDD